MINAARFAFNRIICPDLDLEAFFSLTSDAGLKKVDLRNDLPLRASTTNYHRNE